MAAEDVKADEAMRIARRIIPFFNRHQVAVAAQMIRDYGKRRELTVRDQIGPYVNLPAYEREVATLQEKLRQIEWQAEKWERIAKAHEENKDHHLGRLREAEEKLRQAEEQWEIVSRGKSPCGHWAAHAMTSDEGKTISCLECRAEKAEADLEAERAYKDEQVRLRANVEGQNRVEVRARQDLQAALAAEREAHQRTRELAGSECVDHGQRISDLEGALREAVQELKDLMAGSKNCGDPDAECPLHDSHKDWSTTGVVKHVDALLSRLPEPSGPVKPVAALGEGGK